MSKIYRDDVISIALGEVGYCEKASDFDLRTTPFMLAQLTITCGLLMYMAGKR